MRMGKPKFRYLPAFAAGWLWAAVAVSPVQAGEVSGVSVTVGATGTRAEIQLDGAGEFKTLTLSGPDRLVVDLPASTAARSLKLPAGAGIVTSVRTGQPTPGTLRVVFDLSSSVVSLKPRIEPAAGGSRLVIEWPGDGPAASVATASPAAAPAQAAPAQMAASDDATAAAARATAALTAQVQQQAAAPPPATETASALSPQAILNGQPTAAQVAVPPATPATQTTVAAPAYTIATGKPAPIGAAAQAAATPEASPPEPAQAKPSVSAQAGTRPLVIAIDPGHGGQDPGAIGPNGTYEKNVVLAISKELARQINATPGMRAYLIRDTDVYVERPQRARKARNAKADMFVSIHADAAQNRSAWGSSVYVLSTRGASSQHARWLADKENASDLVGGVRLTQDTLSTVLLDLAQSGHMKASQDAAGHVLTGLKSLGKTHKPQIEFANFEVLRNSDMPAMLVETGFISNHEEEKRLRDPAHQRKVAAAVLAGIQSYFTNQPPPGTLFAARAQARAQAESTAAAGAGAP
ncbi:N-acetylmuramoyl-L-alanine amidase [Pseudoxanthomonas wuyuanensis]|uniref:N-acetylmuramoyl-L-alanine amidase AmiC n=2 Tax=Pseudoxanthomonas wuyuanensis TaxID=1073196 RepID=A0A286D990_9GAMM|nr:N-acetylmuramoyl-L-alanine amidase [Pseudoxanthomonas wuyuanensis]